MPVLRKIACILGLLSLVGTGAFAQSTLGTILGTVTDASGAVIANCKVKITNMQPNLQEQMMLRGDIDAAAVFTVTSYVNLIGQKVDPDKDIRWLYYS